MKKNIQTHHALNDSNDFSYPHTKIHISQNKNARIKHIQTTLSSHKMILENTPQETLLLPLLGRAMANKKWPHLFQDEHSNWLLKQADQLGFDTQHIQMKGHELFCYGIRTATNICYAKHFIEAHPSATIVNMGCGLDDLFQDIDNGKIHYYNVDFPEVIQTREQLIPSHERVFHISSSLTDYEWLQQIKHDSNNGILFLAAGVMYYLTVEEGRGLIQTIAETFTNGQFLFDSESPWAMKQSNKLVKKYQMNGAEMHFMLDDPNIIKSWSKGIHQLNVYYDFTHFLKGTKIPFKYKPFFWFMKTIKAMYFVALKF